MYRKIFLLCCLLVVGTSTWAQNQPEAQIIVLGKSKSSGVWLRWAPTSHALWLLGNKYGYTIERFTLLPNGEMESRTPYLLTTQPLRPLPEADMDKLSERVEEVAVIHELMYGESSHKSVTTNTPSAILQHHREMENAYGIALLMCDLSLETAKAAGLFLEDATAVRGKRYIYRVSLATPQGATVQARPSAKVVDYTAEIPLADIKEVTSTFGDKKVTLAWPVAFHKGIYTAYYVEKSSDGKSFSRLSDLPYVHMNKTRDSDTAYFLDSLQANNTTYYYRIVGISPFGELGKPSMITSGEGVDNMAGVLIVREAKVIEKNSVNVLWEFPVQAEKKIAGYIVARASNPSGPFTDLNKKPILPFKRDYTDQTPFNNTYYQVRAVNRNGIEVAKSFAFHAHVEDNQPPAVPDGLTGEISKTGTVTLQWKPNTDKDIMGYRVFVRHGMNREPVEVSKTFVLTPAFQDTININVLNRKVYYQVVAVDKVFNNSDYSKPLLLLRPDVIAPTAPVFSKTEMADGGIAMEWVGSASEDVATYVLTRQREGDTTRAAMATWTTKQNPGHYTDKALMLGKTYRYFLQAQDSAGNHSEGASRAVFFETGVRTAVSEFKALVNREAKSVTLQWKPESGVVKYALYRRKNEDTLRLYKTLEQGEPAFEDKDVKAGNLYAYKIQIIYASGVRSVISEELKVNY